MAEPSAHSTQTGQSQMECQWRPTDDESEFEELQEAIAQGQVQKFSAQAQCDQGENQSSSEDEDEPDEPGPRLLWAAQHGQLALVQTLLDDEPDLLLTTDKDGYTPLHRACYTHHPEIVRELLLRGADLGSCTVDGWTPLLSAARWNAHKCVELLLNWGANVNHVSEGGQTALHLAAFHGKSQETLTLLLQQDWLDGTLKNCQGDRAVDIAQRNNCCPSYFDLLHPSLATSLPD
eukprot:snap_masked-scaffold886_size84816-processed-gene-0.18 protein:Tk01979 transcript:snap_masked-scaffold886_size84816-processed-gene-0.18-mRNA-1 annotation:"ankyrin repeat domain-containing protein 49"